MYSMFVQQLWGQISSLQGFKLYNIMVSNVSRSLQHNQVSFTAVEAGANDMTY